MNRPRLGRHSAVFPVGYAQTLGKVATAILWMVWQAAHSRRVRAFAFGLPRSRLRSLLVGHYYWWLVDRWNREDYRMITRAVTPGAVLTMFGSFGNHLGSLEWEAAIRDWRQTFPTLHTQLTEFINPPGTNTVIVCLRVAGEGSGSAAGVEFAPTLVATIEDGMASAGAFYENKEAALEAVGLAEFRGRA